MERRNASAIFVEDSPRQIPRLWEVFVHNFLLTSLFRPGCNLCIVRELGLVGSVKPTTAGIKFEVFFHLPML